MTKKILTFVLFSLLAVIILVTLVGVLSSSPGETEPDRGPGASVSTSPPVVMQPTTPQTTEPTEETTGEADPEEQARVSDYYSNCEDVRRDHPNGVQRGEPGYRAGLDRDKDGDACEPAAGGGGLIRDWGVQPYKRFQQNEPGGELELASWTATVVPARKRVIEVIDKVGPASWNVAQAVNWLDRYTASDMRIVARCSGRAYTCITIRTGKVAGAPVGWSQGRTITIDLAKANGSMRKWYGKAAHRQYLLVHELGHQFGLAHTPRLSKDVMNRYVNRYRMQLNSGQRAALATR